MEDMPVLPPGLQPGPQPAGQPVFNTPLPSQMNAIGSYYGDGQDTVSANNWLNLFNENADLFNWPDDTRVRVARTKMVGPASDWVCGIPRQTSWNQFSNEFLARFGERRDAALMRLAKCRQMKGESVASYADRFRRDANLAGRTEDDSLLFHFREGLQWRLKDEVHRARDRIHDLADIIECAKYWEDYYYTVRGDDAGDAGFGYIGGRNNNYNPLPRNDNRRPDYGRGTPADRPYQARGGQQTPFRSQDRNQGRNYQAERPNNFQPRPNGYQPAPYRPYGGGGGNTGPSGQNPRPYEGPKSNSNGYRPAGQNPGPAPQRQGTAPLSVEEITRQMERLQISLAQVAREQRRNEQRGVPMNIFTMEAEDPHPEPKDSQCSYDQGHPFAEEDTEDPYPGYVDVLVGTSGSEGFFVQALDPSDGVDLDSDPDTTTDGDISNLPLLCVMDPVSDAEDDYMWEEDDDAFMYDTLDHQQGMYNMAPAFYSTKRVADNLPPRRAPIKRVAFDPSTFGTSGAAPARNPATAPPRGNPLPQNPRPVPQNPRAVPVPQRNQGSQRPAAPAARTNDPLQPPAPHRGSGQGAGPSQQRAAAPDPARRADLVPDLPADALANSKGKEMALKAARSLTIDAAREANLIVPAAKICAAGHLLCDQNLVEKGKETARRADNFIRRQLTIIQPTAATAASPAAPNHLYVADPSTRTSKGRQPDQETAVAGIERLPQFYQAASAPEDSVPSVTPIAAPRFALCQTPITLSIPGQTTGMELEAIIDTGARECGLPLDTVRRLHAMNLLDTRQRQSYTTASGHKYKAMGKIQLTITLGPLSTVVTFNVTEALTYQLLLGNDFLLAIGAIIDVRSRLLKFQVKPDIEATVPLTLYADENGLTNTMAMEGTNQDVNEAFWNTYAGMDPRDVITRLVEDYAIPMLTMDVEEPSAKIHVPSVAEVSPPATATSQATYVLTNGTTWVCWLTGETYKEPADLYDQHMPLQLPSVDLSRPIRISLDLPVYSSPWFEHMADELLPFACHHDPHTDPSLHCATPQTFQWVMVLKVINFYGYDLFQAYPRFLPSYGRWLNLEPAQIGNMVQNWRAGATAVATAHLLALPREITTNDILGMMCRYQITSGDLSMSLLLHGKIAQAFSNHAAVPAPCGYTPQVTAAAIAPDTTPARDTPLALPPLEGREQAYPSNAEADYMPDLVSDSDTESEVDSMPDLVSESDTSSEVGSLPGLVSDNHTSALVGPVNGADFSNEEWDLPALTDFDEGESKKFEGMAPMDFSPPVPNTAWNIAGTATQGSSPTTVPQHLTCQVEATLLTCTMVPQLGGPFSDPEDEDIDATSPCSEGDSFSSDDQDWDFLQKATAGGEESDRGTQGPTGSLFPEPQVLNNSPSNEGMASKALVLVTLQDGALPPNTTCKLSAVDGVVLEARVMVMDRIIVTQATDGREASWSTYAPTSEPFITTMKKRDAAACIGPGIMYMLCHRPGLGSSQHMNYKYQQGRIEKTVPTEDNSGPFLPEGLPSKTQEAAAGEAIVVIGNRPGDQHQCPTASSHQVPTGDGNGTSCSDKGRPPSPLWELPSSGIIQDYPANQVATIDTGQYNYGWTVLASLGAPDTEFRMMRMKTSFETAALQKMATANARCLRPPPPERSGIG